MLKVGNSKCVVRAFGLACNQNRRFSMQFGRQKFHLCAWSKRSFDRVHFGWRWRSSRFLLGLGNDKGRPPFCTRASQFESCDDTIVSTNWLEANLKDVNVLDVRGHVDTKLVSEGVERSTYIADYDDYLKGHIPGASFWDWTKDGIDQNDPVPAQLETNPDEFASAVESKGVGTDKPVVVYDHGNGMFAARLWWCLMYHGHPKPLVLEGGWQKWESEDRESELHEPCPLKVYAEFESSPQKDFRVDAGETVQMVAKRDGNDLIIDARNKAQFDGKIRRAERGGRLPGAVSLPRKTLLDPDNGALLPLEDEKKLLESVGVDFSPSSSQRIVVYCNGGVAACTPLLALHRLGIKNWALYDGSWNEWGNGSPDWVVENP